MEPIKLYDQFRNNNLTLVLHWFLILLLIISSLATSQQGPKMTIFLPLLNKNENNFTNDCYLNNKDNSSDSTWPQQIQQHHQHQQQHFVKRFSTPSLKISKVGKEQQSKEMNTPILLPLVSVDLERFHVIGWEGTKTSLPCNVTARQHNSNNDSIDLILWFRGQDTKALYSIDARRAPTMQRAKHFSGDELGARAFIDLTTRPTSLVIESVKAEDAGEYRCRVDFRRSPSEHKSIILDVLAAPKEVIIMDEFGQRLNDPITPFNEGAHLNLICEAEGGKPRPLLYWYKNNQLLDDQWIITAQGIVRNELLITKLQRQDQGALLTCQSLLNVSDESIAEMFLSSYLSSGSISSSTTSSLSSLSANGANSYRDAEQIRTAMLSNPMLIGHPGSYQHQPTLLKLKPSQSSILLELNLRPLTVRITTVHRPLTDGQMIVINCESNGARPPALLSWWKSSQRLERVITEEIITAGASGQEISNRTVSTLQFVPSIEDNGKVLSCRADHSVLSDSSLEDSWILNVLFTPKLTISFGAAIQHDNIHERSNVSLECHVAANPPVTEIGWIFEGRRLSFNSVKLHNQTNFNNSISWIEIKANTLFIYHIDRKHSGRYRCVAANAQGEGHSEDIFLKVQYKPICASRQRTLFGVAQREPLQVPCTVETDPEEVTFRWMFNSSQSESMIPIDTFHVKQQTGLLGPMTRTSVARYEPKTRYGYGQLLCWATNKLGEQWEPCRFDIIPAGQPQPLQNCLVRNQSVDGLVVRCLPGDDGGLDQMFHLEVFQADQGQMVANLTDEDSEQFENDSSDTDNIIEFIVRDIPVATTYVLLLYASNAKGRSNYVTLSATTMSTSRGSEFLKFTADFGIKPMMYLLITVVSGLIISAIIIMIVSKVRTINKAKGRHQVLPPMLILKSNKTISNASSGSFQSDINNQNISLDTLELTQPLDNIEDDQRGNDSNQPRQQFPELLDLIPGSSHHDLNNLMESTDLMFSSGQQLSHYSSIALRHHLYKSPFQSTLTTGESSSSPRLDQSNQLSVIIKNPMIEISSGQSPSSMDSASQPPPQYHTVYANDPFLMHCGGQASTTNSSVGDDPTFLMDMTSYHYPNRQPSIATETKASSHATVLNYATSCTTGSMTWSQAETLPLGTSSHGGGSSHPGFLSPTSPISTLSVPFPNQQIQQSTTAFHQTFGTILATNRQQFQLTTNQAPSINSGDLVLGQRPEASNNNQMESDSTVNRISESIVSTAV